MQDVLEAAAQAHEAGLLLVHKVGWCCRCSSPDSCRPKCSSFSSSFQPAVDEPFFDAQLVKLLRNLGDPAGSSIFSDSHA